jgi:hypothetical protein
MMSAVIIDGGIVIFSNTRTHHGSSPYLILISSIDTIEEKRSIEQGQGGVFIHRKRRDE